MAKRKAATVNPDDLTPREGKVLRFFVGRYSIDQKPVPTEACIVEAVWSDLPHTHSQALLTVSSLANKGLLEDSKIEGRHIPTVDGKTLIAEANKLNMWQAPPPPVITNNPEHIDPVVRAYVTNKPAAKQAAKPKPKAKPKAKAKPKPKAKPKAPGLIRIKKAR